MSQHDLSILVVGIIEGSALLWLIERVFIPAGQRFVRAERGRFRRRHR